MPKVKQRIIRNFKNSNIAGPLQNIHIDLFLYINKRERLSHLFYIDYRSNDTWEKLWRIEELSLQQTVRLIDKTLIGRHKKSLDSKIKASRGFNGFSDKKNIAYIRECIESSSYFIRNIDYISNHYAYEKEEIYSYVSKVFEDL